MLVLHDKDTLLHESVELLGSKLIPALESPARIKAIVTALEENGQHSLQPITTSENDQATTLELAKATHDHDYLEHIRTVHKQWLDADLVNEGDCVLPECFRLHNNAANVKPPKDIYARAGYYAFDMSTGISAYSWVSIIASANLAVQAARRLLPACESPENVVLALCRPPGHHCTPSQAGGYCYINNMALCITALRQFRRINSVRRTSDPHFSAESRLKFAVLDIDFHHGNGTQEMFYHDPQVLYVSVHGEDEFPYYTGAREETGPAEPDPAHGTNVNLPLRTGGSFDEYMTKLQMGLDVIRNYEADYLLLSLGFDTFHLDPLGKFDIVTEDYATMARSIRSSINLPTIILLEGGYVIDRLGENLLSFLSGWEAGEQDHLM